MVQYMKAPSDDVLKEQKEVTDLSIKEQEAKRSSVLYHKFLTEEYFEPMLTYGDYNWQSMIDVLIFVAGLIICLTIFWLLVKIFKGGIKNNITSRLTEIAKDIFILLVVISMLKFITYLRVITDLDQVSILEDIGVLLTQIVLLLILVNFFSLIFAQMNIRYWVKCEAQVVNRMEIYREYEKLYMEKVDGVITFSKKRKFFRLKNILKFIILRQEFICQTFTPKLKETVLRDDFRFSDYLGKRLYKIIKKTVSLRISTVIVFIFFFIAYVLIRMKAKDQYEHYIMVGIAIFCFIIQISMKIHSQTIFQNLSHPINSPYEFEITPFDAVRNPQSNRDKIFTPNYLRTHFEKSIVTKRRLVNPHESLFLLSSPKLCLRLTHYLMFLQIIWLIVFSSNYTSELENLLQKILFIISIVLISINLIILMPITMRNFSIITGIEMLKDRKLIFEVIAEQKERVSRAYCKLYRLMKTLKREINTDTSETEEKDGGYVDLIIKLTRSSFNLLDSEDKGFLKLKDIKNLCELLGKKLNKEQLYYLVRRCDFKSDENAVENESNLDIDASLDSDDGNIFSDEEESFREDYDEDDQDGDDEIPDEDNATGRYNRERLKAPNSHINPDDKDFNQENQRSPNISEKIRKDDINITFYKFMEVLEEFNIEEKWMPHLVSIYILNYVLKSKSPISHYEFR